MVNASQNSFSPEPDIQISLTWQTISNPLLWIDYLLPCLLNGVLTITILKDPLKCFRSCSSYLVFNIGLLGFLPSVILISHILASSHSGNVFWSSYGFIFGFYNTLFAVLLLAVDRYVLSCKPLMYSTIVTKQRVVYCVVLSWIFSGILTIVSWEPKPETKGQRKKVKKRKKILQSCFATSLESHPFHFTTSGGNQCKSDQHLVWVVYQRADKFCFVSSLYVSIVLHHNTRDSYCVYTKAQEFTSQFA